MDQALFNLSLRSRQLVDGSLLHSLSLRSRQLVKRSHFIASRFARGYLLTWLFLVICGPGSFYLSLRSRYLVDGSLLYSLSLRSRQLVKRSHFLASRFARGNMWTWLFFASRFARGNWWTGFFSSASRFALGNLSTNPLF